MRGLMWCFVAAVFLTAGAVAAADEDETSATPPSRVTDPAAQRIGSKLSPDEPLYFVLGWNEGLNARFQLSFKYRFVNPDGVVTRRAPFFSHMYFAYTQTSLWDLESKSKPFFDTSYKPSLSYRDNQLWVSDSGLFRLRGQAGFEHESNGQGGEESRSLNIAFVRPSFEFEEALGTADLVIAPKLWSYIGGLSDNPDIADYRGYGELRVEVTGRSEWQTAATFRLGTSGKGSVLVNFTYPMDRIAWKTFDAFLNVQYFNGWGESLRSYNQKLPSQIRIGIAAYR
jgi:phospholipase A1